jgi:predicted dehydrogenase
MKLRMAMIGGGEGSFIGPVHRMAARLDGMIDLVSGAFSSDPLISAITGSNIGLDSSRVYGDWKEMIMKESKLPEDIRPHFVSIVTPNFLHYGPARMALEEGFSVICDKPLCMSTVEAEDLLDTIRHNGGLFCLTHNYTGYPMVKKAREIVTSGEIGEVRKVTVEYFQGWLSSPVETSGNRQAEWRADPERAGIAGAMADIGTHAFNLAEYITGLEVEQICADLNNTLPDRLLDDDGSVLLRFSDGTRGTLLASQIALGEENNLSVRVYGSRGSIMWKQMEPNSLIVMWPDKPFQYYRTATSFVEMGTLSGFHSRLPAGHPEGFIEAFANVYRNFALHLLAKTEGKEQDNRFDYPGIIEGIRGMKFLEAAVASSADNCSWVSL